MLGVNETESVNRTQEDTEDINNKNTNINGAETRKCKKMRRKVWEEG